MLLELLPRLAPRHFSAASACLATPLPANGPREHWMRARLETVDGMVMAHPFRDQDSSLVSVFAQADALIRQAADTGPLEIRAVVDVLRLERL